MSRFIDDALESLKGTRLGDLKIGSPFTIGSGAVTTTPAVLAHIAAVVPEIGFLATKTLSVDARPGYREPIISEYHPGCFVNAVGLANPGAGAFCESMKHFLPLHNGKPLVVSIMGGDEREFLEAAEILDPIADAFELNLSCPHVKGAGQSIGSDPAMVGSLIRLLRSRIAKPIIAKLSPNLADVPAMARLCVEAGADALSLINTVGPGMAVDPEGKPVLSNVVGGLSGAGILPVGLKVVREVRAAVGVPIIASGGISAANDVLAYKAAGASMFSVASALAGLTTPEIGEFFKALSTGLDAAEYASRCPNRSGAKVRTEYLKTTVINNTPIADGIFRLELEHGPSCDPGQFFFLRLAGAGEKPFSPASDVPPVYLIRAVGPFTSALESLKSGDTIWMRGPYGKGFPEPLSGRRLMLVGGGTGCAPVLMAARRWPDRVARLFLGFSSAPTPDYSGQVRGEFPQAKMVADPPGRLGEVVRELIEDMAEDPDLYEEGQVFLCGPTKLMEAVSQVLRTTMPAGSIFVAREDIMRCGIGLCGSCGTPSGERSCVDGPVMTLASGPESHCASKHEPSPAS